MKKQHEKATPTDPFFLFTALGLALTFLGIIIRYVRVIAKTPSQNLYFVSWAKWKIVIPHHLSMLYLIFWMDKKTRPSVPVFLSRTLGLALTFLRMIIMFVPLARLHLKKKKYFSPTLCWTSFKNELYD